MALETDRDILRRTCWLDDIAVGAHTRAHAKIRNANWEHCSPISYVCARRIPSRDDIRDA